jgi:hypothetical protein
LIHFSYFINSNILSSKDFLSPSPFFANLSLEPTQKKDGEPTQKPIFSQRFHRLSPPEAKSEAKKDIKIKKI